MELEKQLAKNLKAPRNKYNITQKELAKAVGCPEKAVNSQECRLSIPDIEILLPAHSFMCVN